MRTLIGPNQYEFRDMKHGYHLVNGEGLSIENIGGGFSKPDVGHVWAGNQDRARWTVEKLSNGAVKICDGLRGKFLNSKDDENDMHLRTDSNSYHSVWAFEDISIPPYGIPFPTLRWELPKNSIRYYVSLDNTGLLAAQDLYNVIGWAVDKWIVAFSKFSPGVTLQASRVSSADQANLIFKWDTLSASATDAVAEVVNTGGSPTVWYGTSDTRTVVFKKGEPWVPNLIGLNVHKVAVHELGHIFGIDHSLWPITVMEPDLNTGNISYSENDPIELYNLARLQMRYPDAIDS